MVALLVFGSPCAGALTDLVQVKSMDSITANTSSAATTKVIAPGGQLAHKEESLASDPAVSA